jgi:hypothetical protein
MSAVAALDAAGTRCVDVGKTCANTVDCAAMDAAVHADWSELDDAVLGAEIMRSAAQGAADGASLVAAGTRCKEDAQRRMVAAARGCLGRYRTEEYAVQKRHMEHILKEFGVMTTVDAFASRDNARFPRFWTEEEDAIKQPWSGEVLWCNPPWCLLDKLVKKIVAEGVEALVVYPDWPRRFHKQLQELADGVMYCQLGCRCSI